MQGGVEQRGVQSVPGREVGLLLGEGQFGEDLRAASPRVAQSAERGPIAEALGGERLVPAGQVDLLGILGGQFVKASAWASAWASVMASAARARTPVACSVQSPPSGSPLPPRAGAAAGRVCTVTDRRPSASAPAAWT